MENNISKLNPEPLWNYFNEICKIPRPSKKEEKIIEFLANFGKKNNLETIIDKTGNVLIKKAASKGKENSPIIVLQAHIDMVCEKNSDVQHDFLTDPIIPYIDGEWVKAKGTTLGADDGIGVAAILAILSDNNIEHGPLECLFTVDEETGLTGAFALEADFLKGRTLLNLDSEDEGQVFIGCAGGKDTIAKLNVDFTDVDKNFIPYIINVKGLKGGHSGDDIHKGLGNANKILVRILWEAFEKFDIKISDFDGGNLRNAIAREAFAHIYINSDKYLNFIDWFSNISNIIKNEFKITEPLLEISCQKNDFNKKILESKSQFKLLNAIYACPHGVISWSQEIKGFVQTSTNLASVKFENNKVIITTSQRSSVESEKTDIVNMVASVFRLADAKIEHSNGYPGWTPNANSKVLEVTKTVYKKLFSQEPEVLVIHAGLECGLIGEKYPGMDMISFGPTIKGAHSPDERLHIESVTKFWDLLLGILSRF
jgi:dipeptidase D